jgi:hypothetical protein
VKYVAALSVFAVMLAFSVGARLYRGHKGRRNRRGEGDLGWGLILGILLTAIAFFVGAYWWFERSFGFAALAGLLAGVGGGVWILAIWPDSGDS